MLPVAFGVLLFVSVPFVANARVGVLGVSFLNDTHWHLILAEGLRHPSIKPLDGYGPGYPVGPHAVAATFAQLLGSDVDKTLTGVLMAVPILTALAALGMLSDVSTTRRWVVAVLAGIPYLAAASYAESAFKEPILSLLMVGLVVALQAGTKRAICTPGGGRLCRRVCSSQAVLYDYSYPGLVWPAAIVGVLAVARVRVRGCLEPAARDRGRCSRRYRRTDRRSVRVRDPGAARLRTHPHVLGEQSGARRSEPRRT